MDSRAGLLSNRLIQGILFAAAIANADTWTDGGSGTVYSGSGTKVGVGTSSPTSVLQVEGNGTPGSPGSYPAASTVHFISWAGDGPSSEGDVSLFRFSAGRIATTDANASKALVFAVSSDDVYLMSVKGDGKVGIGTTVPTERLHVAGSAKIDGALKIGPNGWSIQAPDYVFENSYKLKSLDSVEAFVRKNKHLPEVPSAKEMKKKGVDLVEMNFLLLKKIEELTLHVIEQQKRIEKLEKN